MLHSALWPHSISHWDSVVEEDLSLHGTWKGRSMGIKTMRGVEKEKRWERDRRSVLGLRKEEELGNGGAHL